MTESTAQWKQKRMESSFRLEIPADHSRSEQQGAAAGAYAFRLSTQLVDKLTAYSQAVHIPLSSLLLAGFKALLYRYTAQEDIFVGSPVTTRSQPQANPAVRFPPHTLMYHTKIDGQDTYCQLVERVYQAVTSAWQDYQAHERSNGASHQGQAPAEANFPNVLFLHRFPASDSLLPTHTLDALFESQSVELALWVDESHADLKCILQYNAALFEPQTIIRAAGHFERILTSAVEQPEHPIRNLPYLSADEIEQLLVAFNASERPYPRDATLAGLFEAQAARAPDSPAVLSEAGCLTYHQLNSQANQLAHHLIKMGAGPEVCVGICLERSPELIIAILGILKAGGAYVPLDPDYPPDRLDIMLADSSASVVVTKKSILQAHRFENQPTILLDDHQALILQEQATNPESTAQADSAAYVIFTSGSTGRPKGVLCVHRSVVNLLTDFENRQPVSQGGACSWWTSAGFDVSVYEIFSALLYGRALLIVPPDARLDSRRLFPYLQAHKVKSAYIPPSFLSDLADWLQASGSLSLERLLVGVEPIKEQVLARIARAVPGLKIINGYGPTEATVCSTLFDFDPDLAQDRIVPIGRPVQNTQIYLLDGDQQLVPIGVAGEIYIGGDGLARGYIHQPERTAQKFVPSPFDPDRNTVLYRTGDMARCLPDGNIVFLGRFDEQVKINGYRIELGEIESVLRQHPAVKDVLAAAREPSPGDKRLVAYIILAGAAAPTTSEWRSFLRQKLPNFMVPSAFVILDAFPLTTHGKVDKKALPEPDFSRSTLESGFAAPRTPTEETIAEIWAQMFNRAEVGIFDNFFDLGGDSILSIQITAKTSDAGIYLTPNQIFDHPTIAELASLAESVPHMPAEQGVVVGPMPLTPIQRWFFAQQFADPHHWNQSFLLQVQPALNLELLRQALHLLLVHHDALRLQFRQDTDGWHQQISPSPGLIHITQMDLSAVEEADQRSALETSAAELQASLDLAEGPLLQAAYFHLGPQEPGYLLLAIHHLVVDGVSWRILLEHLDLLYRQLTQGKTPQLPPKTTSYKQWALRLREYAQTAALKQELAYWLRLKEMRFPRLPVDFPDWEGRNIESSARSITVSLNVEDTEKLLRDVPKAYHTQMNDVLLTALAQAFAPWTGSAPLLLNLEGHGREAIFPDVDLLRTVGWFTTFFPLALSLNSAGRPGEMLASVKEQVRLIPNRGIGYGLLRYLCKDSGIVIQLQALPEAEISFNYLGQFDQALASSSLFRLTNQYAGPVRSARAQRHHLIDITGIIIDGQLQLEWRYSTMVHRHETIENLAAGFIGALSALIAHCQSPAVGGYTPSDFPEANLSQQELDDLLMEISALGQGEEQ